MKGKEHSYTSRRPSAHSKRQLYSLGGLVGAVLVGVYTVDIGATYQDGALAASIAVAVELLAFAALFLLLPNRLHTIERCFYPAMTASIIILAWLKITDLNSQGLLNFERLSLIILMLVMWLTVYLLGSFLTQSAPYVRQMLWGMWIALMLMAIVTVLMVRLSPWRPYTAITAWAGGLVPLFIVTLLLSWLGWIRQHLATTDALTGVANRYQLGELLEHQYERAVTHQTPFAILLVDLDHFKAINDTFGHAAGDAVLADVSALLLRSLRKTDFVGRWGGDEFLVVLPNATLHEAAELAERIRATLAGHMFRDVGAVTVTIGVQSYRTGQGIHALLAAADEALYAAKSEGRNSVGIGRL